MIDPIWSFMIHPSKSPCFGGFFIFVKFLIFKRFPCTAHIFVVVWARALKIWLWTRLMIDPSYHIWVKSCRTGKKCSKCPKTALTQRVVLAKRLVLATCPFGFLEITMSWCSGMIFIFLECQETCAGNIEIPGNSRKSIFLKNIRKMA